MKKPKHLPQQNEFIAWYEKQTEWSEDHDYQSIRVSFSALQNCFMEMKDKMEIDIVSLRLEYCMEEMKLYEVVNRYHIGTKLSCAEAMLMACNEYYHLNLSEETRKMFSVMGIGMQTRESCCGAFTVAVGIIGLMTAKKGQTNVGNIEGYRMITELTNFMLSFYETIQCSGLKKLEIVGYENPCHAIVETLAKNLEELLADRTPAPDLTYLEDAME